MCQNITELKSQVRREVIERRNALTREQRDAKSAKICASLGQKLAPTAGDVVAVYAGMTNEVSLHAFIHACLIQGATVCFPVMKKPEHEGGHQTMEFRSVNATQYRAAMELQRWTKAQTESAAFHSAMSPTVAIQKTAAPFVANPLRSFAEGDSILDAFPLIDPASIDIMVTPLVAFDKNDNRLGYGGGNYDRYLPQLSDACQIIAVAFREQEVAELPTEEHDVRLSILTD